MLDHVFTDAIGAVRDALEGALLERQALEERFQTDVFLGDTTWETTYALPGEGDEPRVMAVVTLAWPTWSQTAYRTWFLDDAVEELPRIEIEVVFRLQHLDRRPEPAAVVASRPAPFGSGTDEVRADSITIETHTEVDGSEPDHAVEIGFRGGHDLDEEALADGTALDRHFSAFGSWVASALVRLGDLPLSDT